jgi:hypothetical protein
MPTMRRKIRPRPIDQELPAWAYRWLLTGEEPDERTDPAGYDQHFGFAFCGEKVAGLGRMLTEDDSARIEELRRQIKATEKLVQRRRPARQDRPPASRC